MNNQKGRLKTQLKLIDLALKEGLKIINENEPIYNYYIKYNDLLEKRKKLELQLKELE